MTFLFVEQFIVQKHFKEENTYSRTIRFNFYKWIIFKLANICSQNMKINFILIVALLLIKLEVFAQNYGCFDSLKVSVGSYCPPDYEPVCACNQKTYRNFCYAQREGYQIFQNGICEPIDINIRRNPVHDNLMLDLRLKFQGDASIYIFDVFGHVYFYQDYSAIEQESVVINTESYPRGIYLILGLSYDHKVVKKFLKIGL